MNILKEKTHFLDIEVLACKILGLDYDEINADTQDIENKIEEEFSIDLDTFQEIISRLLPLVGIETSTLTGKSYKGFVDAENGIWLVKMKTYQ